MTSDLCQCGHREDQHGGPGSECLVFVRLVKDGAEHYCYCGGFLPVHQFKPYNEAREICVSCGLTQRIRR